MLRADFLWPEEDADMWYLDVFGGKMMISLALMVIYWVFSHQEMIFGTIRSHPQILEYLLHHEP